MAGKATAIDPGSHTWKALVLKDGKHGLALARFAAIPAGDAATGLATSGIVSKDVVAGLAGRDMTLRFTQVPPSPDWQLANLMDLEIQDMAGQTGDSLSADYNLLPIDDEGGMDTILLAFARDESLEGTGENVQAAGGAVAAHVPNCIALYNCFLRCGAVDEDEVTCLVNIGHETTDIAIVRGTDLIFVRNLTSGGKVFDDAIAAAFNVRERKAQELKRELLDLDPASRGRYASGQAEKVTMAAIGSGNMITSAIQSSLAFCRNQTKQADLQLDKVLISGGTARTRGMRGMLREALRCPVEVFDPFEAVDTSALPPEDYEQLESMRSEAVVALGLAIGRVDDSTYSLEILPEAVKRRRNFVQRTIWNIAAAVVGVVLIGLSASTESARADAADSAHAKARRRKIQIENVHKATEELVVENQQMRELVDYLAARTVPHDGVLITLADLQSNMPAEGWLELLEVKNQSPPAGGSGGGNRLATGARKLEAKPLVVAKGRLKDVLGRDVGGVYRSLLQAMQNRTVDGVTPKLYPNSRSGAGGETSFTWQIDYRPAVVAKDSSEEGEGS